MYLIVGQVLKDLPDKTDIGLGQIARHHILTISMPI